MPQHDSNQQLFRLSLPWRVQSRLGSDTSFVSKLAAGGANENSILNIVTIKAYLERRRAQIYANPPTVVECKSVAAFEKAIATIPMSASVAERFAVGSGDLWWMVTLVAGLDCDRPPGSPPINIFIVKNGWGGTTLERVDILTRGEVTGNLHEADQSTWLTVVHADGDIEGEPLRPRANANDDFAMGRARR